MVKKINTETKKHNLAKEAALWDENKKILSIIIKKTPVTKTIKLKQLADCLK